MSLRPYIRLTSQQHQLPHRSGRRDLSKQADKAAQWLRIRRTTCATPARQPAPSCRPADQIDFGRACRIGHEQPTHGCAAELHAPRRHLVGLARMGPGRTHRGRLSQQLVANILRSTIFGTLTEPLKIHSVRRRYSRIGSKSRSACRSTWPWRIQNRSYR
jgi:hypothetical protein